MKVFYDQIQTTYNFFRKFKIDAKYKGKSLKRVIDTRWSGHYYSTCTVLDNFGEIIEALDAIIAPKSEFDGETMVMAIGLRSTIGEDFRFKVCCVMMQSILGILKPADNALQNRATGINTSWTLIDVARVQG